MILTEEYNHNGLTLEIEIEYEPTERDIESSSIFLIADRKRFDITELLESVNSKAATLLIESVDWNKNMHEKKESINE